VVRLNPGLAVLYLCYFLFYFIVAALVVALLSLKWRNGTFGTVTQVSSFHWVLLGNHSY
jgi:hypothetical protein